MLETFEAHKQALLDARQRKAQAVFDAAARILDGLPRRTERFTGADELNAFFAGDPLVLKLRELAGRLRELRDSVKADDVEARLKGVRDQAVRSLRDRSDLFEDGGSVIRLGPRHRFSVNTQPLDLTILPRGDALAIHLTGTDYYETLHDPELEALRDWWQVTLEFLDIVTRAWPGLLEERDRSNPAAHRNALILAERARRRGIRACGARLAW